MIISDEMRNAFADAMKEHPDDKSETQALAKLATLFNEQLATFDVPAAKMDLAFTEGYEEMDAFIRSSKGL